MTLLEDLADRLAQETLEVVRSTGDEGLEAQVSEVIGASSQTMQEAFLTALRVRKAEARARELLARRRG